MLPQAMARLTYQPDDYIGLNRKWLNQRGFRINHLRFFQAEGIQCIQRLAMAMRY